MKVSGVIHVHIDGKVFCGSRGDVNAVVPRLAQFVTCKRCLRSLHRVGR